MALIHSHSGQVLLDTTSSLVIIPFESTQAHEFHFELAPYRYRCPIREALIPCFRLRETVAANDFHNSFYAYFCDYAPDGSRDVRIGQAMDYFFTASLSGCSVSIGKPDATGRMWVGHANAASAAFQVYDLLGEGGAAAVATARVVQQQMQHAMLAASAHGRTSVYSPPDYGHHVDAQEDLRTTLIGFRDKQSGVWSFIRQTYDLQYLE